MFGPISEESVTGVGAILRFLTSGCSPSAAVTSLFPRVVVVANVGAGILAGKLDAPACAPARGVIGGVGDVNGGTKLLNVPDPVAATLGNAERLGVGLLVMLFCAGVCANDDMVATDEVEFVLVGLGGRKVDTGDGAGSIPDEACRSSDIGGAVGAVGVGCGVD